MRFRQTLACVVAGLILGTTLANGASIKDARSQLTGIVQQQCLAMRSDDDGRAICGCEARNRIARLSDAEVMTLLDGRDVDRSRLQPRLKAQAIAAFGQCVAERFYPGCVASNRRMLDETGAKAFCGCMVSKYQERSEAAGTGKLLLNRKADARSCDPRA